jgi:hypothetical protein
MMPRRLFRVLVAVLLGVTVPVQGLTAVEAGLCMAMSEDGQDHTHEGGSHDHGGAAPAHDHGQPPAGNQDSGNAHCPPCATAAIAPTAKIALPDTPPVAAIAAPQSWISGVVPDDLDRPPLAL